jgi:hypothetical protein
VIHETVPLARLGLHADTLDGAFLDESGERWGLLLSLRGKAGGALLSPTDIAFKPDVPAAAQGAKLAVFVRRPEGAMYLGIARRTKRGRFVLATPLPDALWRELIA